MKKKISEKKSLFGLFSNNKFTLFFSFLVSVIIWALVAVFASPVESRNFNDISVNINTEDSNAEQLGLSIFGQKDFTVNVTVKGKRYEISPTALSADDFIVTADCSSVDSSGKQVLNVKVSPANVNAAFEITNYEPKTVTVYFDYLRTRSYSVKTEITPSSDFVSDEYIKKIVPSRTVVDISGPVTKLDQISSVIAKIDLSDKTLPLTKTETFETTAIPVNEKGGTIPYVKVGDGNDKISVTIQVLKSVTLKSSVRFTGTPSYFAEHPIEYTCYPDTLGVAISDELLNNTETLDVGTIDFSKIKAGKNEFTFNASDIRSAEVTDGTESIKASFEMKGFISKTVEIPYENIKITGVPDGYTIVPDENETLTVKATGLENEITSLTEDSVFAYANATGFTPDGSEGELDVQITFVNAPSCWTEGSYKIPVVIS
ncbi:MAG: hypothetical protein K6F09_01720 [Clostridiales bacterium]|nr:hypothetical protein [Clostridiales bacterium]